MEGLELWFDGKPSVLSVHHFITHEEMNEPFVANVWARSENANLDLEPIVGRPASFVAVSGEKNAVPGRRNVYEGIVEHAELVKAEPTALSTYYVRIVPKLWLLTQRRGYRIFQHMTAQDIVKKLLAEWKVDATWTLGLPHEKHLYKVQYGETDYAFICRLMEEAGIAFTFPHTPNGRALLFSDSFHLADARPFPPIHYVDNPNEAAGDWFREFVTHVRIAHAVRPGARTLRDYDFRRPDYPLFGQAPKAAPPEDRYEQYHYRGGGFVAEVAGPGSAVEDDKATARHDEGVGKARAAADLAAMRGEKRSIALNTNVLDLWPGINFHIGGHLHRELSSGAPDRARASSAPSPELHASPKLLLLSFGMEGTPNEEWSMGGIVTFADVPHRPPLRTPRPTARLQTAVVVGPKGQEIHTDEHGRVRVQFPWDREGKLDDNSTPWLRTSQGWAGKGFGMMNLPRIGQEVLVDFLDGDPEQPVIVARVFNTNNPLPHRVPEFKTRSAWKSDSSIGSDGYNEIYLEDDKNEELVSMQAEKNLRHFVKNNEVITVGNNREKEVKKDEWEKTGANRVQVTDKDRSETTTVDSTTVIGGNREMIVGEDETERTFLNHELCVAQDQDSMTGGMRREVVREDDHLLIDGDTMDKVGGHRSMQVKDDQWLKVGRRYAKYSREETHLKAGDKLVCEAGLSITFRGPAGFVRIGPGGVTIKGKLVKINSGGSPGDGRGAEPAEPEIAAGADDEEKGKEPAAQSGAA